MLEKAENIRNDLTTDTDRLTNSVGKLVRSGSNDLPKDLVCIAAIVADGFGSLGQIVVARNCVWLSIVTGFNGRQGLSVVLNQLSKLVHELAPVASWKVPPAGMVQRGAGGLDGLVDVCF